MPFSAAVPSVFLLFNGQEFSVPERSLYLGGTKSTCRWQNASGLMKCPRSDCKDGWIIGKQQVSGRRSSSRKPPDVKLCPECKGVGKVVCPECKGMRADLCKRCFGTGRKR